MNVVCEVRFFGDLSLLARWGHLQEKLKGTYPKLLVPSAQPGTAPLLQPLRLATADDDSAVLFSLNLFALSTNSYSTYEVFRGEFETALRAFQEVFALPPLNRLSLQYKNILPSAEERPDSAVHPFLKVAVSGMRGSWNAQPQLALETRHGRFALRTAVARPVVPRPMQGIILDPGVRLDFDCFTTEDVAIDSVLPIMDEAHGIVEDAFFSIITDEYLGYLKGELES